MNTRRRSKRSPSQSKRLGFKSRNLTRLDPEQQRIKEQKLGNARRHRKKKPDQQIEVGKITVCQVDPNPKLKVRENGVEIETMLDDLIVKSYSNLEAFKASKPIIEEDDYGNTEYKLKLIDNSPERLQQLTTQMKFRIQEGLGEAFYKIGYQDNGIPLGLNQSDLAQSFGSLCHIAKQLKAELVVLELQRGQAGLVAEISVRKIRESVRLELKIMLIGCCGSGKSTLVDLLVGRSALWAARQRRG